MELFDIRTDERIPEGTLIVCDTEIANDVDRLLADPSDHEAFKRIVHAASERMILTVSAILAEET